MVSTKWLPKISREWRVGKWPPSRHLFAWTLLVAFGYIVAGRMGQLLAFPPTYATAIWPPSGIALAAVLMLGRRAWLGIFLGALVVNGWTAWFHESSAWSAVDALIVPVTISLGATGQALLGGYLIHRQVGFPNPLIHDRQILAFLALGGPVACLLGPTCGVATLAITGKIQGLTMIALNWWTCWLGDVIGVTLFAPLLLIAFARPRKYWRPRWISVSLPLGGAIAVTVFGFIVTQLLSEYQSKTQFERIAGSSHQLLDNQIELHLDVIDAFQRYFVFSQSISQVEFAEFSQDASRHCEAAKMVAWVPREGAIVGERVIVGEGAIAGERASLNPEQPERFRLAFTYPEETPLRALGIDLAARQNWQQLMEQCCDSGNRLASPPFLVGANSASANSASANSASGDRHVLVLAPVYERGSRSRTIAQRRQNLTGFVVVVIEIDALVHSAEPLGDIGALDLRIIDITQPESPRIVHAAGHTQSPHKSSEVASGLRPNVGVPSRIQFSGRVWDCRYLPTAMFYAGKDNRHHWTILASGLALTACLGAFLLVLSGRTAQIETSEARYLDLYENAPDMFISLDVGTQRVIECNRTFLDSTGFQKHQVLDKYMVELLDPDSHIEARRAFRAFRISGHISDIEMRLRCHDGSLVDISMKMSAVKEEDGGSVVCRAALRDITARKRVEADLKAQEMELAHVGRLTMMGEMATGLAHEINQPLAAIAAYAEGASIRLRDGKPDVESLTVVLERIALDAHRAGQVIRRLRQFLRKRTPERTSVKINDLVREVAQFVEADLRRREVRIGVDLGDRLPPVQGDPIQLQQVLLNLVRNGCDAMVQTETQRRSLMIRTRCRDGESIHVTVEDCGHGLSSSVNDQLFEAFFSTKDEGLGMGLAISRSIIESHGGQIWATSNLEGGASFQFSLPATAEIYAR